MFTETQRGPYKDLGAFKVDESLNSTFRCQWHIQSIQLESNPTSQHGKAALTPSQS